MGTTHNTKHTHIHTHQPSHFWKGRYVKQDVNIVYENPMMNASNNPYHDF